MLKVAVLFLITTLAIAQAAWSLPSDRTQHLTASSDQAEYHQQKNTSIYTGNVRASQGTTNLQADKLTVIMTPNNEVQNAIAEGNPATYTTKTKVNKPNLIATAKQIEYSPLHHQVILTGNALVKQGTNSYKANIIHYDTLSQVVSSPSAQHNRSTIIIQP